MGRWIDFARRRRRLVVVFWLIAAVAGVGVFPGVPAPVFWPKLGVNSDTSDMLSPDAPHRVDDIAFRQIFNRLDDQILVLVRAESQDAADLLAADFVARLRSDPTYTAHVNQVFAPSVDDFFKQYGLLYLDAVETEGEDETTVFDAVTRINSSAALVRGLYNDPTLPAVFDTLERVADTDIPEDQQESVDRVYNAIAAVIDARVDGEGQPLSWRLLFDEESGPPHQVLINIDPILDTSLLRPAKLVEQALRDAFAESQSIVGLQGELAITGNPVLRSDELRSVSEGIGIAFLISFFFVGALLLWAFRSVLLSVFTLISLVVSISVTSGFAAVAFGDLNLVSVAFTVLMVGLGVDFAVHLLLHARHESQLGYGPGEALQRTSKDIGAALALTAPSTALAFFAFAPTAFTGMTQLGVVAGVGVLIAFMVATSLLPAVFAWLPAAKSTSTSKPYRPLLPQRVRVGAAIVTIVLGVAALPLLPNARFDADPMALRDPQSASVEAFNLLFDDEDTAPYRLSLLADDLDTAAETARELKDLAEVHNAITLMSFVPEDQDAKLDQIGALQSLAWDLGSSPSPRYIEPDPEGRLLAALGDARTDAERGLRRAVERWRERSAADPELGPALERDIFRFWPQELSRLQPQVQLALIGQTEYAVALGDVPASIQDRYLAREQDEVIAARVEIIPEDDVRDPDTRRAFVAAVRDIAPNATGGARNAQAASDIIQAAMVQATLTAMALVSLLLWVVLRDVRLIAVILTPLALAAVLTTATGVLLDMPYNFANVIVLPLLIGIGVDSGIHLALRARKVASADAVYQSVTPRAVFFSALTTIASFGSLSFSAHRGTASMGSLLMIAIGWTLVCTVFVLPLLMQRFARKRETA